MNACLDSHLPVAYDQLPFFFSIPILAVILVLVFPFFFAVLILIFPLALVLIFFPFLSLSHALRFFLCGRPGGIRLFPGHFKQSFYFSRICPCRGSRIRHSRSFRRINSFFWYILHDNRIICKRTVLPGFTQCQSKSRTDSCPQDTFFSCFPDLLQNHIPINPSYPAFPHLRRCGNTIY